MHQKNAVFLFVILLVLFTNFTASGQENNPEQKEEALEADSNQDVLHEDMKKFKQMFLEYQQSRQPQVNVRDVEFDLGENPVKGSPSARLMIIQFSDYTCHYCARHSRETFPEIDKNYIKTGKIRYTIIDYPWPGNTRELIGTIKRASVMCDGDIIGLDDLPLHLRAEHFLSGSVNSYTMLDSAISALEKTMIIDALKRSNGSQTKAARLLGISDRSMWYRVKKYEIGL